MPAEREVEARVRGLITPALARRGLDLVDVEYRREPVGWMLRVYVDKPNGVTLSDCQRASEEIGTLLEVEDAIPHRFTLEVSSPGLDRPLTRDEDFRSAMGRKVKVTLRDPMDGRRHFTARLSRLSESSAEEESGRGIVGLVLTDDAGGDHLIPLANVDRARLVYEWPESVKPGGRGRHGSGKTGRKG